MPEIAAGGDPGALVPFAKAYLGLFAKIEGGASPTQRVAVLAEPPLLEAVLAGFEAVARNHALPSPGKIGRRYGEDVVMDIGYPVLAGMHRLALAGSTAIGALPPSNLAAALCFHYANPVEEQASWYTMLLRDRQHLVSATLKEFWLALIAAGKSGLPGFHVVTREPEMRPVLSELLLPLLESWTGCRRETYQSLLLDAMCYVPRESLLSAAASLLDGGRLDVAKQVFWLSVAFLIEPDAWRARLGVFIGRSKERALRMLEFMVELLRQTERNGLRVTPEVLGDVLRLIGPRFPPKLGHPGAEPDANPGELDDIDRQVMYVFERLADAPSRPALDVLRRLRRVRVMGSCADALNHVESRLRARV